MNEHTQSQCVISKFFSDSGFIVIVNIILFKSIFINYISNLVALILYEFLSNQPYL